MKLNQRMTYDEQLLGEKMFSFMSTSKYEYTDIMLLPDSGYHILVVELYDRKLDTYYYVTKTIVNIEGNNDEKLVSMVKYIESDIFAVEPCDGNNTLNSSILSYFNKSFISNGIKRDSCNFIRIRKTRGDFQLLLGYEDDHIKMNIPRYRFFTLLKGEGKHELLTDYLKKTDLNQYEVDDALVLEDFGIKAYDFIKTKDDYSKDINYKKFVENKNKKISRSDFEDVIRKGVSLLMRKRITRYGFTSVRFLDLRIGLAGNNGYIIDSVFIIDNKYVHVYYKYISVNEMLVASSELEVSSVLRAYYIEHIVRVASMLGNVTLSGLSDLGKYGKKL